MLFKNPTKDTDGIYYARATTDNKKKHFVQLNKVSVAAVADDQVTFELTPAAIRKIAALDEGNLQAALDNAESWFGREMTREALEAAYCRPAQLTAERIPPTKVFSSENEPVDFASLKPGDKVNCIIEFVGLYFAKQSFGSCFNAVQVKIHAKEQPEYPVEYAFGDETDDEEEDVATPEAAPTEPTDAAEPVVEPEPEADTEPAP